MIFSWGNGHYGQLGLDNVWNHTDPQWIVLLKDAFIQKVAAGGIHSAALSADGQV
jgi:alpha-tubulin suppressor-like RCC1 family protein